MKQELYWTSTTDAGEPEEARAVNLGWSGVFKTETKSLEYWTWAVRQDADTGNAPAKVAATNQTDCFNAEGATIDCRDTGQDGDIQAGVPWPSPRFSDNGDRRASPTLTAQTGTKSGLSAPFGTNGRPLSADSPDTELFDPLSVTGRSTFAPPLR